MSEDMDAVGSISRMAEDTGKLLMQAAVLRWMVSSRLVGQATLADSLMEAMEAELRKEDHS